jgi:hypothetical protein
MDSLTLKAYWMLILSKRPNLVARRFHHVPLTPVRRPTSEAALKFGAGVKRDGYQNRFDNAPPVTMLIVGILNHMMERTRAVLLD